MPTKKERSINNSLRPATINTVEDVRDLFYFITLQLQGVFPQSSAEQKKITSIFNDEKLANTIKQLNHGLFQKATNTQKTSTVTFEL